MFRISENIKRLALAQGINPPYSAALLGDINLKLTDQHGPGANVALTYDIIETQRTLIKMQGATIDGIG